MMSPRVQQYCRLPASDKELMARIFRPATMVQLGLRDSAADVDAFTAAAKELFVPSPQHVEHIRALFDEARGHAERNFATDEAYLNRLWEDEPWTLIETAICITGLSGVGKSHLRRAILQLLSGPEVRLNFPRLKNVPVVPGWFLSMVSGSGLKTILGKQLHGTAVESGDETVAGYSKAVAIAKSRTRTWRNGTALILPDELQFFTRGTASTVRVTSLLLDLMSIGPLVAYIVNFSLAHALKARMDEDSQRLLAKHRELKPDTEGCRYWIDFIAELIKINPDVFSFSGEKVQALVHRFSFGRRRVAAMLFATSLIYGRNNGRGKASAKIRVDEKVLERAYHSAEFFIHRETNELFFNQTSNDFKKRTDLWSPFTSSAEFTSIVQVDGSPFKKAEAEPKPTVENLAAEAAVVSAALPDERAAMKGTARRAPAIPGRVARPRVRRKGLDGAALLENMKRFEGNALSRLK